MSDPIKYYVTVASEQKGPYTLTQLQAMWSSGSLTADTLYWYDGQSEWMPLGTILELLETPTNTPQRAHSFPPSFSPKVGVQTIEATSKKWKAAQLIGGLVTCLGFAIALLGILSPTFVTIGALLFVGGLVTLFAARIGAWWNHG